METINKMFKSMIFFLIIVFSLTVNAKYPEHCVFLISGKCFDCYTPYTIEMGHEKNCITHCPNRFYNKGKYYSVCRLEKMGDFNFPKLFFDSDKVPMENCEKDGYFYNIYDNECYSCNAVNPVVITPDCENDNKCLYKCPNRTIQYISQTEVVSVLKCPEDRPLLDKYLICWSCDEPTPIDMSFNQDKIWGSKYSKEIVCKGKRYIDTSTNPFSYPCPQNKNGLSKEACSQCGGEWYNSRCF